MHIFRDYKIGVTRLACGLLGLLPLTLSVLPAQNGPAEKAGLQRRSTRSLIDKIESNMPALLDKYAVPGTAIALIRGGEVVWTKGFGKADSLTGKQVTTKTEFNVGSLSKTPTAWAVMRLVEEGKIGLDRPIDTYLKRWHLPPSSFDNSQVTVRRLLSHTSGISAHDYHGWDPASPLPPIEDSLAGKTGTGAVHLASAPGSAFSYSGANYAILQLLAEEVSGQPFAAFLRSRIFQPLGMTHTQYGLPSDYSTTMAIPYDALERPLPILRYNEFAAAGLTTNLNDLAIFAAASVEARGRVLPGRGILKAASVEAMESPTPATRWADKDPYGPDPQYGFGYTVRPDQFAGKVGVGHGGTNNGWESLVQIIPSTGDGIVIMTNSSNGSAVIACLLCYWREWAAGSGKRVTCPTIDVRIPLFQAYRKGGIRVASNVYRKLRQDEGNRYDFSSVQLNSMGYQLMRVGDTSAALEIFKLNVEQFPQDWNVYDSLGEAYLKLGDKAEAIVNYKKSLELNPNNDNGREVLKRLGAI